MLAKIDQLGAVVTLTIYLLCSLTFTARLLGRPRIGRWFGYPLLLTLVPLIFLLCKAVGLGRPFLYLLQLILMIGWLLFELVLDYVLKADFRATKWLVIIYVTFFFAATGGMLGVAAYAGRSWSLGAIVLFAVMAALAFVQRAATGI